jgi:hypothetical protein
MAALWVTRLVEANLRTTIEAVHSFLAAAALLREEAIEAAMRSAVDEEACRLVDCRVVVAVVEEPQALLEVDVEA